MIMMNKDVAREYLDLLLDEGMDQERAAFYEAYIGKRIRRSIA